MPHDLLVEVGTEEIPASFLKNALEYLGPATGDALGAARLDHGAIETLGTPRRLTVYVHDLAEVQTHLEEEMVGPPARVAFDESGAPTKAAQGFAKRNAVALEELRRGPVAGKKGDYLLCTRREEGMEARRVLPELLRALLLAIPWPKAMRWGCHLEAFARPVHWLVALLGGEVLPLDLAGVSAGNETRGHRFLAPAAISLPGDLSSYESRLREALVVVSPDKRRTMIEAEISRLEQETGCTVRPDPELLDEVADLLEYPVGICGQFPESYLEVPEEVVVSAMRSHQRYFAMNDSRGRLTNRFVTMAGTVTRDAAIVRAGNERVLAARLADAQFFFREDRKRTLEQFASRLSGVVFEKKLGTYGDKMERMTEAARELGAAVGLSQQRVERAARLCKADLASQMVWEFPDLQGTMGRHYAQLGGEVEEVATAIEEHYLPRGAGDEAPHSDLAAVLGVADRMDTVVGGFAVGLAPTGSADPYGLRRAALGILRILMERQWQQRLQELIATAAAAYRGQLEVADPVQGQVLDFFRVRLRGLLSDTMEIPADCVDAALAVGYGWPADARARAAALAELRRRADFEPLAAAFKRISNILKGQAPSGGPDPAVFAEAQERVLWEEFLAVQERVQRHLGSNEYVAALHVLTELKEPVDRFFDAVLVMDDSMTIRQNRLAMLGRINETFTRIADFRHLAV